VYQAKVDIPETMLVWPLYGVGLENLGRNGQPARWPVPRPAPDQILVRSDAVGLCYSDVKILRLGRDHPRLYGRDLEHHPIVQGHEVALTVVEVGEAWRDRFRPGQRLALQADIYYRGFNLAYGYVFYGGLAQYSLLGPAALAGDEGCYAIPVPEGLGYAETALTEPWACVEAAYTPRRRLHVKPGGVLWIIGRRGLDAPYVLGRTFAEGLPHKIVLTDVPNALACQLGGPEVADRPQEVIARNGVPPSGYQALARVEAGGAFDDIIVLEPEAAVIDALSPVVAAGATVNLAATRPLDRAVQVDLGRIHYDYIVYLGTRGSDIGAAYGPVRNRSELRRDGVVWVVGGGGPMGRMHLQRMLEMPPSAGPRQVVVAETNTLRSAEITHTFAGPAAAKGVELTVLNPRQMTADAFDAALRAAHGGGGFDDIVVIVASAPAVAAAMPHLAPDGMLQVFGGLARGTEASLDLSNVYLGSAQLTGSAGSTIRDQAAVITKVRLGHLSTASAVAAIGGMSAARDGMQGLIDGRFPGKVVIFPQVETFPLTALADLEMVAPAVHKQLGPGGAWTRQAEAEFLQRYAGDAYRLQEFQM